MTDLNSAIELEKKRLKREKSKKNPDKNIIRRLEESIRKHKTDAKIWKRRKSLDKSKRGQETKKSHFGIYPD